MADHTKIEWTDSTWQIVTGCSVVSPGCTNCYAMRLAGTRLQHHPSRIGLTEMSKAGPVWNGQVRFNEQWLDQPLRWRKPRRIFVCAHGDLFHENVPDEWIDQVFAVMALANQHKFQVLTKRPKRMLAYLTGHAAGGRHVWPAGQSIPMPYGQYKPDPGWPLPNVWLGVSAEDQPTADWRIPLLLQTPAAMRWVSAEPLLGAMKLAHHIAFQSREMWDYLTGWCGEYIGPDEGGQAMFLGPGDEHLGYDGPGMGPGLDWVVAGGESGPGARPAHPDWFRSLRDQCQAAGVAFHFKQWGEWAPVRPRQKGYTCQVVHISPDGERTNLGHPYRNSMARVGKKAAGRELDGRTWDEYPEVKKP